jgi:hypothetical protein
MAMKGRRRVLARDVAILGWIVLGLAGALLLRGIVQAQRPQQAYDLSWWTVDGGGGNSSGGNYLLDGTAGQPDPGPVLSGGNYQLEGGFWGGGLSGVTLFNIYLPLVLRGY